AARLRGRRRPVQDLLVPPPGRRPARTGPEGGRAGARRLRGGAGAHPRRRAGRAVAPGGPGRGLPAGPCPLRRPRRTCRNPKGARMTATPAPHEQAVRDGASPAGTDEAARAAATRADLEKRFAGLALPTRIHLDGQDADAVDGATFDRVSPRDGTVIARVSAGGEKDIDRAVASARRAFASGVWPGRHPRERRAALQRLPRLIEEHAEELARLESVDTGKPYTDALAVDLRVTLQCLDFYAEAADKLYDEVAPTAPGTLATITREPLGVVGAVVPWNFPLMMAMWKIAPALAVGNAVVLKPAEQSPLTALRVARLATEAGLPDGILNVVPGFGPTAGAALGRHPDVDAITFTGSGEVGRLFLRYAADSNLKQVSLELGGKSPQVVMPDAPDLRVVARAVAGGIFFNQGEVCSA